VNGGSRSARGFVAGDRVLIDSPGYPVAGHAGRIAGPSDGGGRDWSVDLADRTGCATTVRDKDLRLREREANSERGRPAAG
jgi:hypothetical protein